MKQARRDATRFFLGGAVVVVVVGVGVVGVGVGVAGGGAGGGGGGGVGVGVGVGVVVVVVAAAAAVVVQFFSNDGYVYVLFQDTNSHQWDPYNANFHLLLQLTWGSGNILVYSLTA